MTEILAIREELKRKSNKSVRASTLRFVPGARGVYGVKFSVLAQMAKKYRDSKIKLTYELWKSDRFEEQILAAKILAYFSKKYPEVALKFITFAYHNIFDWAVCDTLATQALRPIARIKRRQIFNLAEKLTSSKNIWKRRFGTVLLVNFAKDKGSRKEVAAVLSKVSGDERPYVKKAVDWVNRNLQK